MIQTQKAKKKRQGSSSLSDDKRPVLQEDNASRFNVKDKSLSPKEKSSSATKNSYSSEEDVSVLSNPSDEIDFYEESPTEQELKEEVLSSSYMLEETKIVPRQAGSDLASKNDPLNNDDELVPLVENNTSSAKTNSESRKDETHGEAIVITSEERPIGLWRGLWNRVLQFKQFLLQFKNNFFRNFFRRNRNRTVIPEGTDLGTREEDKLTLKREKPVTNQVQEQRKIGEVSVSEEESKEIVDGDEKKHKNGKPSELEKYPEEVSFNSNSTTDRSVEGDTLVLEDLKGLESEDSSDKSIIIFTEADIVKGMNFEEDSVDSFRLIGGTNKEQKSGDESDDDLSAKVADVNTAFDEINDEFNQLKGLSTVPSSTTPLAKINLAELIITKRQEKTRRKSKNRRKRDRRGKKPNSK